MATEDNTGFESESYKALIKKLEIITQLKRCKSIIGYDQMVFMPKSSPLTSSERGAQMSALAGIIHEKETDKAIHDLIVQSENDLLKAKEAKEANSYTDETRLLELEKKFFVENERVPKELASKRAGLAAKAHQAWVTAREKKDFALFEPILRDCFETAKEIANAKRGGGSSDNNADGDVTVVPSLYTQMLDEYEIGMPKERIDEIFTEIRDALVPLIGKVLAVPSENSPSKEPLKGGTYPIDKQKEIGKRIVKAIGFNDELGRIDVAVHPFTSSSSSNDVRITSRYSVDEWHMGLIATIHEGGHAIYEQNLKKPSALRIDSALSMGTHESQSLFWERHVGKSNVFWKWATPIIQEIFTNDNNDNDIHKYTADDIYRAVNAVSPSLIRVEADELTYPLHVILRYQIETDIVEGNLDVKDIPQRWNDDMKSLLNVDVPSDDVGCLQDVHWSAMAIGYFPTYLLGSSMAAQLYHYCRQDIPNMDELIENGEFTPIRQWLTDKVHKHGMRYKSLDDLLQAQVGEKLNPKYFIEYLTEKYTDLYRI